MTDLVQLGAKLHRVREQLLLSASEVEASTGVKAKDLLEMEAGRLKPTGDQLLVLSELFVVDYKFFLSNERKAPFEQTEILYRKHGTLLTAEDRRAIQETLYLCENEAYLQDVLGRTIDEVTLPRPKGSFWKRQGRESAAQVRQILNLKEREAPKDVFKAFRGLGIHIFRRPLSNSNISGLCMKHPSAGLCILVNYVEDQYRQRFTVSHEVAHALLDVREDEPTISLISEVQDPREWRANAFANAFLVPPAAIENIDLESLSKETFIQICQQLMVNAETLLIAFKECNNVSDDQTRRFVGIRVPKPQKEDPELGPDLTSRSLERRRKLLQEGLSYPYLRLCLDGYREGKVSLQRLSEVLRLDLHTTIELMTDFREGVAHHT